MSWTSFNVNHHIRVKITPAGYRIHKEYAKKFKDEFNLEIIPLELKTDYDDWYEDQMWEIMSIFGPHLYNGGEVPFETDILLEQI